MSQGNFVYGCKTPALGAACEGIGVRLVHPWPCPMTYPEQLCDISQTVRCNAGSTSAMYWSTTRAQAPIPTESKPSALLTICTPA